MGIRLLAPIVLLGGLIADAAPLSSQTPRDATVRVATAAEVQQIRLVDGTSLVGRIVALDADSARVEGVLGSISLARTAIVEVRSYPEASLRNGVIYEPDPNATRLFFAPTGRVLERGEGYVANHMLFVLSGAAAVAPRVTLGAGLTIFPMDDFSENLFFVTPKVGVVSSDRVQVAAGALFGVIGGSDGGTLGVAYGVATTGSSDAGVSVGAGWGMWEGRWSASPVVMGGGNLRTSRRTALITENYLFPTGDLALMYGVRFFGERLTADFALVNHSEDFVFPGFPFIGIAVHF